MNNTFFCQHSAVQAISGAAKMTIDDMSLVVGTWAWGTLVGDKNWGNAPAEAVKSAADDDGTAGAWPTFKAAVDAGVGFFDTAEIYSSGGSERAIGWCMRRLLAERDNDNGNCNGDGDGNRNGDGDGAAAASTHVEMVKPSSADESPPSPPLAAPPAGVFIATKYVPLPYHYSQSNAIDHCRQSLKRLGVAKVDLFQIHGPAFSIRSIEVRLHWYCLHFQCVTIRHHLLLLSFSHMLCATLRIILFHSIIVIPSHTVHRCDLYFPFP
jgi:hypothetical protein